MHKQFTDNKELLWKDKVGSQNSTSVQFSDVVSYALHSKTGFKIPTKIFLLHTCLQMRLPTWNNHTPLLNPTVTDSGGMAGREGL